MLAIAIEKYWPTAQSDVKCAYLNGKLTEDIYKEQPYYFKDPLRYECRLKKIN